MYNKRYFTEDYRSKGLVCPRRVSATLPHAFRMDFARFRQPNLGENLPKCNPKQGGVTLLGMYVQNP